MFNLEKHIFLHTFFKKHIKICLRYVDDIFTIFTGNKNEVEEFVAYLSSLHPNINLTYEIEIYSCLPFLDLLLINDNNSFKFEIYRKFSAIDKVIPFSSNHPYIQKFAAFN